jgi:hypothetical protein
MIAASAAIAPNPMSNVPFAEESRVIAVSLKGAASADDVKYHA